MMLSALTKTTLACALLVALPTGNALAGSNPAAVVTATQDDAPTSGRKGLIKFTFGGGTASQLFTQLGMKFPDFPVVLGTQARNFEVPAFEALISEPGTIVDLVCGMDGWCSVDGTPVRGMLEYRNVNNELVSISFMATGFGFERTTVSVLSIQELLTSGMSIKEIMGTIQAGIEIQYDDRSKSYASVRFHEQTGVLFVKGSKDANNMVKQTVEALTASAKWRVSPEAMAAKEARIKSEALEFLEEATMQEATIQMERLQQLRQDHERLMEEQRRREDAKDAELERQLEAEFGKEDE